MNDATDHPVPPEPPRPPTASWPQAASSRGGPERGAMTIVVVVASLLPAALALYLFIAAPTFYEPLWATSIRIFGLLPVVWFVMAIVAVPLVDLLVLRFVRSSVVVAITLAVTVTLGLCIVMLGPAVVLIMENIEPQGT